MDKDDGPLDYPVQQPNGVDALLNAAKTLSTKEYNQVLNCLAEQGQNSQDFPTA
jgi:hypothetical protein